MNDKNINIQENQQKTENLSNLKDELIKQASDSIKEDFVSAAEDIKEKRAAFGSRLKTWLNDQFGHVSNTLIALLVASIMTVLMPLFVETQVDEKLNNYNDQISTMISTSISENLNINSGSIKTENEKTQETITLLQEKVSTLEALVDSDQYSELDSKVNNIQVSFQSKYDGLNSKVNLLKDQDELKALHSRSVIKKLNYYKSKGRLLISSTSENEEIKKWIEEVYYFISLIKFDHLDMSAAKQSLFDIYKSDKPLVSSDTRIESSIVILNALSEGIQLVQG